MQKSVLDKIDLMIYFCRFRDCRRLALLYGAQFSATFCSTFIFRATNESEKKAIAVKVAWFFVFRPAECWVYSYYILWARRDDAKVGEFGFPENLFVYGYSNYMV